MASIDRGAHWCVPVLNLGPLNGDVKRPSPLRSITELGRRGIQSGLDIDRMVDIV